MILAISTHFGGHIRWIDLLTAATQSVHDLTLKYIVLAPKASTLSRRAGKKENNWLCPPVGLILRVIKCCREQKAKGTLVVPYWPSSFFWSIIKPDGKHFADFIRDHIIFYGKYESGNKSDWSIFNSEPTFDTLALRIEFVM